LPFAIATPSVLAGPLSSLSAPSVMTFRAGSTPGDLPWLSTFLPHAETATASTQQARRRIWVRMANG
jgi:hypothetical protein